jgi:hypothetical protein
MHERMEAENNCMKNVMILTTDIRNTTLLPVAVVLSLGTYTLLKQ